MLNWESYIKVADRFKYKARREDREDLRGDIILELAKVELKYNGEGKTLSDGGMIRVASYRVAQYWRQLFKRTQGIDCSHCSKAQRLKCQSLDLYASCPKKRQVVSLSTIVSECDGEPIELIDTLADDKAIDLDQWLDDKTFLYSFPTKLVKLAYKKASGYQLTNSERTYFYRHSKKAQKQLLQM